jgi:hypothetical protein
MDQSSTDVDVGVARPPWSRIVDLSAPADEYEIEQWGLLLWLLPGDLIEADDKRWRDIEVHSDTTDD